MAQPVQKAIDLNRANRVFSTDLNHNIDSTSFGGRLYVISGAVALDIEDSAVINHLKYSDQYWEVSCVGQHYVGFNAGESQCKTELMGGQQLIVDVAVFKEALELLGGSGGGSEVADFNMKYKFDEKLSLGDMLVFKCLCEPVAREIIVHKDRLDSFLGSSYGYDIKSDGFTLDFTTLPLDYQAGAARGDKLMDYEGHNWLLPTALVNDAVQELSKGRKFGFELIKDFLGFVVAIHILHCDYYNFEENYSELPQENY